jgi:hypothetical protein
MCKMCDGMTTREYWGYIRSQVLEHGWFLQAVEGGDHRNPPFAYTVGLSRFDHPEIIAFGMHPECAFETIAPLAQWVLAGARFEEGDDLTDVFGHLCDVPPFDLDALTDEEYDEYCRTVGGDDGVEPPELLRFPDSSTHLLFANDMYRGAGKPPVPALQVFWPSEIPLLSYLLRRAG